MKMCVNPSELSQQSDQELERRVYESSVSIGSQQLCLYDDNNNLYDILCTRMNGKCHKSSKKCAMSPQQYKDADSKLEKLRLDHETLHELPYNYTNDILIVIDGTGTRSQFEEDGTKSVKGGEYNLKSKSRWNNGNWANHNSNFYEDYRGVKYYWYGPDANEVMNAEHEVKGLVIGAAQTICEFINNHTTNERINIDLVGYSRGGYAVMETARKLDRDGCELYKNIQIRFMGLYDPVSSTFGYSNGEFHANVIDNFGEEYGLFTNDDYKYESGRMPTNVDHIVAAYGDPKLGSQAFFNTCDEPEDDGMEAFEKEYFIATHGGIGGSPLNGDFDLVVNIIQGNGWQSGFGVISWMYRQMMDDIEEIDGYGEKMECSESMKADMFIRGKANEYGLPIDSTNENYYDFYQCPN